jgi:Fic family protein
VNREWTWDDTRINSLLEETTRSLAELDAFSKMVPDVDRYIYMHVVKEANTSSRIEGTRTEMDDALRDREYLFTEYYQLFLG